MPVRATRPAERVTYPARDAEVVAVGATTEHGCLASYSNYGTGLDLVAPGGGRDANITNQRACRPGRRGSPIYQITLDGRSRTHFELTGFIGTSMAAPHVAATAALVVASGVVGENPSPAAIEARLEQTARDLGRPGPDRLYGCGPRRRGGRDDARAVTRLHDCAFLSGSRAATLARSVEVEHSTCFRSSDSERA